MKWKDVLFSWIGRINIVKMVKVPKAIYKFNEIPIKVPMTFFRDRKQHPQKILKFVQNNRRPWRAKATIRIKKKDGDVTLPDSTILQSYNNQNSMVLGKTTTTTTDIWTNRTN